MKTCQKCGANYTDDSLNFCLECGAALIAVTAPNSAADEEMPTMIRGTGDNLPTQVIPIPPVTLQNQGTTNPHYQMPPQNHQSASDYQTNQNPPPVIVEKRRSILPVVLVTFLLTIILFGLGGIGAYFYLNRPQNIVSSENKNAGKMPINKAEPTPTATPKSSPTPTATPAPTLDPETAEKITDEAKEILNEWKSASENYDLAGHIGHYAETLDFYYNAKNVPVSKVRADRQKAYETFNDLITIYLSDIKVTPDASGNKATVEFDKEWDFAGTKFSSGKVRQQVTLSRLQGEWKITGERDLKIYYVDKGTSNEPQTDKGTSDEP